MLNLKVALVKEALDHPKADKLVVLKLDLGKEERQIVAGIKEFYSKDELKGKKIIVVTNLQPAELRGEKSNGMLLACEKAGKLGLVTIKKAEPGTQVLIEGAKPNKDIITIEDFKTVKLRAKDGKAFGDDKQLKAGDEELFVEKGVEGKIR